MSGPAWKNKNRSVHRAITDLIGLFLDQEGITAITKRTPTTLSDSMTDDVVAPDLAIKNVHLDVTTRLSPFRLSEALESAERAAAINETPVAGFVQWRGDRPVADSYVVLSLRDFSKLVRGDHLTPR